MKARWARGHPDNPTTTVRTGTARLTGNTSGNTGTCVRPAPRAGRASSRSRNRAKVRKSTTGIRTFRTRGRKSRASSGSRARGSGGGQTRVGDREAAQDRCRDPSRNGTTRKFDIRTFPRSQFRTKIGAPCQSRSRRTFATDRPPARPTTTASTRARSAQKDRARTRARSQKSRLATPPRPATNLKPGEFTSKYTEAVRSIPGNPRKFRNLIQMRKNGPGSRPRRRTPTQSGVREDRSD